MLTNKKMIAIVGATGAQGGGLARAILNDPQSPFTVRALTRHVDSAPAQALARLGAEVVAADIDDPASMQRAFTGACGAFCVTFFWAHFSPDLEIAQATRMAQATKQAGVQHVIWSTLEDSRTFLPLNDERMPTLMGKYKVPHIDAKGEADAVFRAAGTPTTFLVTSYFWENLINFGLGPKRGADGKLALVMPMGDKKLPGMAAEDIGKCAYGIFKQGSYWLSKTVGIAGQHLTGVQMAASLTCALGESVTYHDVPPEVYRSFGFPGATELGNMFQVERDFNEQLCAARSLQTSWMLNPALQTFDRWLAENKQRIPLV